MDIYTKRFYMSFFERPKKFNKQESLSLTEKIQNLEKDNLLFESKRKEHAEEWFKKDIQEDEVYGISNFYDLTYSIKEDLNGGDSTFVPRFSLKKFKNQIFAKFPPKKEIKYDRDLMVLAMQYGMILQVQYRGADDTFFMGRTRVILPMCLGSSAKGKPLLRVFHMKGWSFSQKGNTEKIWRMFRTDRIMSMSFTGNFFRLTPEGYNALDKGMLGGITKSVDIEEVRRNQEKLAKEGDIQAKKEVVIDQKNKVSVVEAISTNSMLDLRNPFANKNIERDNLKIMRITFLKSTTGKKGVAILGALGQKGNIVKISSSGKFLGEFRVMKSTMGDGLGKPHLRDVEGISEYELHVFVKKRD